MTEFILTLREEPASVYDANREINNLISQNFEKSKEKFIRRAGRNVLLDVRMVHDYDNISIKYWGINSKGEIEYKSLSENGCAVFCFEEGLYSRKIHVSLNSLVKEICQKGYYYPGRGMWHNLFDHYGLRRATSVNEIYEAIKTGHVVTCLVDNMKYGLSQGNAHFINIVGVEDSYFIVDDPSKKERVINAILIDAIKIAWIW